MAERATDTRLQDETCALVGKIFGMAPARVERIRRGVMTFKFLVELSGGDRYIIRFYPAGRAHVVQFEPDVLRRCRMVGVPVPEVVVDSRSGPTASFEYLVYRMIEGKSLSERYGQLNKTQRSDIGAQLVAYLHKLGELRMTGYGDLLDGDNAKYKSWHGFLKDSFDKGLDVARQFGLFSKDLLKYLERVRLQMPLVQPTPVLTWGDVSTENILVDVQDKIAGLIDFEGALAGDTLLNLGYCFAGSGSDVWYESLIRAWPGGLSGDHKRRVEFYAVIRALRIAINVHKPLPTGHMRMPLEEFLPGFPIAVRNLGQLTAQE